MHIADQLIDAVERAGSPVCVGIDPVFERLPDVLQSRVGEHDRVEAVGAFAEQIVEAVSEVVPCVKFQSACFERYGSRGVAALERAVVAAREAGLVVILDAKRGDIGITAEHYAAAARHADWLTINTYLGTDGIEPFLANESGCFALVRTSNPGGDALQELRLTDGRTIATAVADMVASIGGNYLGHSGYSALGAVVGATRPQAAAELRQRMPEQIFLVPGYGAQGGSIDDVLPCFHHDGRGAVITSSRSVIYAFDPAEPAWTASVKSAARRFADEISRAVNA